MAMLSSTAMTGRAFGAVFSLILLASMAAGACTCSQAPPGKCPGLRSDDVVFLGTVTQVEEIADAAPKPPDAPGPPVDIIASRLTRYHFHIDERFAGPSTSEIDVFAGGDDDGDCGFRFKNGEKYVVFTQAETEGRLFATICNGTRPAADARALLPQLRAMGRGQRIASVFGVLHRTDPPFLAPEDDPYDPLVNIPLKLRSTDDRFQTSTGPDGVYTFYDVHAGQYVFSANLSAKMELSQKTLTGGLPPFKIPSDACFEYDVDALPTGHIRGSVLGPDGKPLEVASVELYRAGAYQDARPGLWSFQNPKGQFDFDHVGPGDYVLVFNRMNSINPNSPFPRAFYPGVGELSGAEPIRLKDGQTLEKVNLKLTDGYPTRRVRVNLKWAGNRPPGDVVVSAEADMGENPAAHKIDDATYEFPLVQTANYTIAAYEDLAPKRAAPAATPTDCAAPARIQVEPVVVHGSDEDPKEITLAFPEPVCVAAPASAPAQ
jgi:hypothetical protein